MLSLFKRYSHWLHTQWPAGPVEKGPAISEGGSTALKGVRIVGDLTGVPLLKFSADSGAKAVQAILQDRLHSASSSKEHDYDLVIIGAGVSGISAAIEAKKLAYTVPTRQTASPPTLSRKPIYTILRNAACRRAGIQCSSQRRPDQSYKPNKPPTAYKLLMPGWKRSSKGVNGYSYNSRMGARPRPNA